MSRKGGTYQNCGSSYKSKTRAFINKNVIRVVLQKDWNNNGRSWIVSGYGLQEADGKIKLEATETIKAVTANYGYKPEHSFLREQVGAVIASISNMGQEQQKVKSLKQSHLKPAFVIKVVL